MEKTILKTFDRRHLERTWEWVNAPETARMTGTVYPVPWAGHLRWFRALKNDPLRKHFAIEKSGGIYIGNTGIKKLDPANRSAELFIYIGEERERGRGAGAAATELLAAFCFDRLGCTGYSPRFSPITRPR